MWQQLLALCQIIQLNADDVMHKGTGTLCEALLTVQTYVRGMSYGPDRRAQERREVLEASGRGVCLYIALRNCDGT